KEQVPRPSWTSILKQWKSLGFIISIAALVSALIWIPISFVPFYLMHFKRYSFQEVLPFTALTLILHILFMILTGLLSQKINYYRLMIIGAWATCIFSFPLFYYLINGHLIAFIIGLTFLSAIFGTVVHAVMLNIFPIQSRGRGISLGFMIGSSLGGASPSICAYLIKITDNHFAPALYLMMLALQWIIWRRFYLKNKLFSPKQNISGRID
ncbi:MAG: transporter, partial [Francisellaceae bacterium]|nr:transporter [Francisellaceae bacterium]